MEKIHTIRKWLILIFVALIVAAFLFVWWMSFSNFKSSYREIKQQYYSVVTGQVVSELEASIKYGKSLDSFYNINSVFAKLQALLPQHVKGAITNSRGEVLYTSFESDANKESYLAALKNSNVTSRVGATADEKGYTTLEQGSFEVMILPISDKSNSVIGSFMLVYPVSAINEELRPQWVGNLKISLLVLVIPVLLIIIYLSLVPIPKEAGTESRGRSRRRQILLYVIPALVVMLGIGVQSSIMYNQYQGKYKSAISDGAQGILGYIENSITAMHQKGVPYERMYGLSEYLASKAKNTPIIWNIRIYNTIADTGEALKRENSWGITAPLVSDEKGGNMQIEIQISQDYMKQKMLNILLVFLVTMIVAAVVIIEAMRLPELLIFRRSGQFNTGCTLQYERITGGLRVISFITFMAMYSSIPFSVILMRQWEAQLFGLSTDLTASIPLTAELLAIMLFSMIFARFFSKTALRFFIYITGALVILGNVLCASAAGPVALILSRCLCGAGFAGIKHVLNNIISFGSEEEKRTGLNIAGMNAGLLGGIMCGGSLGAVIANSMGISFTYLFTAGILLVVLIIMLYIIPWRLLKQNMKESLPQTEKAQKGMLSVLMKGNVLKYLFMVTLPLNLGLMFIVAFIPSYVQKMNLPVLLISYGYLINGLIGIYLGPALVKLLTGKLGRTASVSVMLAMGGAAVLVLGIQPSIAIILLSTALMGLFDGFGSPVATDYFLAMPEIKDKVEVSNSLAIIGVLGNATQMVSPMIYGWLMLMATVTGFNTLMLLGGVFVAFAALFLLPVRRDDSRSQISA